MSDLKADLGDDLLVSTNLDVALDHNVIQFDFDEFEFPVLETERDPRRFLPARRRFLAVSGSWARARH